MQITNEVVALLEYELTADDGTVIDSSKGNAPLTYINGKGHLIPGLEAELEGKSAGDEFKVRIEPEQGYGQRNEQLVQAAKREQFPADVDLEPGMQFQAQTQAGPTIVTVVRVEDGVVTLDGNHPLAGVALNFDVKVVEVREATAEEKARVANPQQPPQQ